MNPLIHELHYSNTNTILIKGTEGYLLFDTGWAGTFPDFCRACGAKEEFVEDVMRMYLTHRDVGVQGILDRIEMKGR